MFRKYLNLGNTNPIQFTTINSFTISILGEWLVQTIELKVIGKSYDKKINQNTIEKPEINPYVGKKPEIIDETKGDKKVEITIDKKENFTDYDIDRFKHMTAFRMLIGNPFTYVWYTKYLPFLFPSNSGKLSTKMICSKIAFDQTIFGPWCIVSFNYFMCTVNGKEHDESMKRCQRDFWPIMILDWCLWPTLSFFNFRYTPINYQPSVVYCASMIWTGILSWMYNREVSE